MVKNEAKNFNDKTKSDAVARTKVSHGRIETAIRVRTATTTKELDLETRRLNLLNKLDKTTLAEELILPKELHGWQQLVLVIGTLNLKSSKEVYLACKRLGYSGGLHPQRISAILASKKKEYFKFYKEKGWTLTNAGDNEFSRLKQFL
ncbi:hypothetical protein COU37_01285 [Candidatus Micrarchaeota archaeon CG10_big_fil_rev_8_21_14_0_10_45_29]|nr:MAG: hypothetical protein COU37_01285 [Candidatus Micrarchaeota archaeon CG10_big_fil_rev_8_21_14_0_10_45_29]